MKVCMLAYTFYEMDNRVRRYAEALVERGDQVDVIALRRVGAAHREVINGVNVYKIQKRTHNEKRQLTYLTKLLFFLLRAFIFLTNKHVRTPYALVHVHSPPDFKVFSALIPKLLGAKVILDIHDLVPEFYAGKFGTTRESFIYKMLVFIEKASIGFADYVIAANDIWRNTLVGRAVSADKCMALLNYPDTNMFQRQYHDKKEDRVILMYPGTLNQHQGLDIAIRAMSLIKDDAPEAELHIYGLGGERDALQALTLELNLSDSVFFNDPVPSEVIPGIMSGADIGIVPKRSDGFGNEAFSTKTLEFMAIGVPLIVADTRIDRYYFDSTIVRFFRSGDEHALASEMLNLIKHPDMRRDLAERGYKFAMLNTWESKKRLYLDLVDSLTLKAQLP